MKARDLQQADLAEVLGVSLDRVKGLTSGRVKKLTSEESNALVRKHNVRAEWLISGEEPMFRGGGMQGEFTARRRSSEPYGDSLSADALPLMNNDLPSYAAPLSRSERKLLDDYQAADSSGKKLIEDTAAMAAKAGALKKRMD